MKEGIFKTGVAGLGVILAYYTDKVSPLIWLLVIFEIMDYATGILAGIKNGGLESQAALWGFVKKVGYFILIGVAFGVDYIVSEASLFVGLETTFPAVFGIFSICYLLSTEAISVLENLSEFGISVPFLDKALKKMRDKVLEKGEENK